MVVSNEPGIYVPGHAGYRISDSMLVTASGSEPLTAYPRGLDDCTIASDPSATTIDRPPTSPRKEHHDRERRLPRFAAATTTAQRVASTATSWPSRCSAPRAHP